MKPSIQEFENPVVEVIEGDSTVIKCKGKGKPPPKFAWIKSVSKEDLAKADRFMVNEDTGDLTITSARREDGGEYQCVASNKAGMDTMNVQVSVIVRPKIMEFVNQTIAQGQKVTMGCKAFGRPPPIVTFRKHTADRPYNVGSQADDDRIELINKFDDQKGETVGELTIRETLR